MSITIAILIVTGIISYQGFNNRKIIETLKHYPVAEHQNKEYYRMLSSGFVHGDMMHLVINGYVLYMFGTLVENKFSEHFGTIGPILFLLMYLSAIVVADIPTHFRHKNNPSYAAVWASGATSALALIFCAFYPWARLDLMFIIPMPAIVFAILYLVYSSWADKNRSDGIGHSAHLYGALYGIAFIFLTSFALKPELVTKFMSDLMRPSDFLLYFN